uniref:C2H2-type domain-containing protein n=1 Tax=Setaria digitata TaxID=48799 RepID=A0A915PKH1_9BILA
MAKASRENANTVGDISGPSIVDSYTPSWNQLSHVRTQTTRIPRLPPRSNCNNRANKNGCGTSRRSCSLGMDFASFAAAALRNSAVLPCESFDSYWITNAPVQFGLKGVKCTFRFETSFADAEDEAGTLVNGDNRHTVYILWISSCEDPSLLYSCRMDSKIDKVAIRYGQRTPSIVKNMIEGANLSADDPRFTMINLIGEQEMGLFIRLCVTPHDGPSALRLALRTPSAAEWKSHLLMFIQNLQNDLWKERWQRELLEKDALSMKSQIAQMERKRGWLEKELEMLYAVMQQQNPVQSLKVANEVEASLPKREEPLLQPVPTTSTAQITDAQESPKFNEIAVSPKRNSPSSSPTSSVPLKSGSNFKKKRTNRNKDALANDDLLIGVASLLSCAVCPGEVTLRDQDGIKEHFINQHLDGEQGRCRVCTEAVKNSDMLNHMKAHLVKEYACEFCGKKGRKHYLKAHIRIHTGERPYKCEQCARRFADSSTYRRHQMIHTGEKRYSCPVCGRCIARKDNVKTHLRSHVKTISSNASEAAAWMETLLNSLPTKMERNSLAVPPLDSPTSVENNEDQNLLGDFNLLESLKEDEEMSDKS